MATKTRLRPDRFIPQHEDHLPSLGYCIIDQIEFFQCHGPGDVAEQRVNYDEELRDFIIEAYRIDPVTGRKSYSAEVLSRQKGRAKSEVAGHLAVEEGLGYVRFDHWADGSEEYPVPGLRDDNDGCYYPGEPVLRRITTPMIKCLASEESQAGNTFEVIAFICSEWGPDHHERYQGISGARQYQSATSLYIPKGGEWRACSSGAASKDGGKETFVVADETHLYVTRELKDMYSTISKNLGSKRMQSEPHLLQTSTAPRQGERSVYEETLTLWRKGELSPTMYFDHREAKGPIRIRDKAHTMKQLEELWGEAAEWQNMERKYSDMIDPQICRDDAEAARYYLNRMIASKDAWIAKDLVERQQVKGDVVAMGEAITIGCDPSLNEDSTVMRGCRMSDGYRFTIGMWEKPEGPQSIGWEVPRADVLATFREAMDRYNVIRSYWDPHEWRTDIDNLAMEFGEEKVFPWETRRETAFGVALDRLHTDITNRVTFSDTDPRVLEHYGNAYVWRKGKLRLVRKEYPNSPRKIDSVPADALAYEARADAIADGWDQPKGGLTRVKGRARGY